MSVVTGAATIFMPFADLIDIEEEKKRLLKKKERLEKELKRSNSMLSNEKFLSKAPEEKIKEEREKLQGYEKMMSEVEARLKAL